MKAFGRVMLLAALCAALACGEESAPPRAQWLIRVQTDTPVPQFGDRLLVELVDDKGVLACRECRRLFGVRAKEDLPLSFGIADPGTKNLRLRVRMFRADRSSAGGEPEGGLPIDVLGALPDTGGAVRRLRVDLHLLCAGVAADLGASTSCTETGEVAPIRTFADDHDEPLPMSSLTESEPCPAVPEKMVCVPGSVFALGHSSDSLDPDPRNSSAPERLVRIPSFAMDLTEMTVGEMRALVAAGKVEAPITRSNDAACTYTDAPESFERHPVNCVSRDLAEKACSALGKRLPTEAEWEFAAGNGAEETTYAWGEDDDTCTLAILGRGRTIIEGENNDLATICRTELGGQGPVPWGPVSVDEGKDVSKLGIRHLSGNMSEWVSDFAHGYSDCFSADRPLVSPRCDRRDPNAPELGVAMARGGNWQDTGYFARVTRRNPSSTDATRIVGFRCVIGG